MKLLLNVLALVRGTGYVALGLVRVIGMGLFWWLFMAGVTLGLAVAALHRIGARTAVNPEDLRR